MTLGGLANRESEKTVRQRIQTGAAVITNRGVISGCVASKSDTAMRNLSVSAGTIFLNGVEVAAPGETNSALVPVNTGNTAQTCYAYLYIDGNKRVQFTTTPFGETVPANGLPLYRLTVPTGNTESNDPNMTQVTLTDVRRLETGYPLRVNSIAYDSVALTFSVIGDDYNVALEILDAKGGWNQRSSVYVGEKATNGFKIFVAGSLDTVNVRWTAIKNSL